MQVSEDDRWVNTTGEWRRQAPTRSIIYCYSYHLAAIHFLCILQTVCFLYLVIDLVGFNVPLDTLLVILEMILLTNHSAGTSKTNVTTTKWQHKSNLNNDQWKLLTYAKINLMNLKPGSGFLLHHPERKQAYSTATGPIYNF